MDLFRWLKGAGDPQAGLRVPDGPPTPPVRRRYRFSGLVQGVGFRWEAMSLASQLGLVGWARNERDGSVTVEIEGERGRLDVFLRAMESVSRFDITEAEAEDLPVLGSETAFKVRY